MHVGGFPHQHETRQLTPKIGPPPCIPRWLHHTAGSHAHLQLHSRGASVFLLWCHHSETWCGSYHAAVIGCICTALHCLSGVCVCGVVAVLCVVVVALHSNTIKHNQTQLLPYLPTLWLLLPVEMLQGITLGCSWSAGTVYCRRVAPPGMGTTTQGIFAG